MPEPDLKQLHNERFSARSFQIRNAAYHLFEMTYNSDSGNVDRPSLDLTYRPNNVDGVSVGQDSEIRKIVINQVRRVVAHFGAMFAHRPRVYSIPQGDTLEKAEKESDYIEHVFRTSNLDALHPQQSHNLALRGDAVFGVDWGPVEGTAPRVRVRTYDPRFCYPLFSPEDLGAVEDMLIAMRVHPAWARVTFNLPKGVVHPDRPAELYYYWTAEELYVQVEEYQVKREYRKHALGFCPFRWVFGDPSKLMAQADCREVPKLQEVFNEALLLTIDAVRKQVDPAWWVTGLPKDITPEPGVANALPEGSQIGKWPIEADPSIIMTVMTSLEEAIYTTTGVSPISMGAIRPTERSGAAVRNQVEASDARAELRKVMLEATYARLGEMVLSITNQIYPQELMMFASAGGIQKMQGQEFTRNPVCGASYGDFISQQPEQRFQIAMQGLGRLWDAKYAISRVLNLPGINAEQMEQRLREYQIGQAKIQAEAQAAAQQIAQQSQGQEPGQPGGGAIASPTGLPASAGAPFQRPQRPPQPTGAGLRRALAAYTGQANGRRQL